MSLKDNLLRVIKESMEKFSPYSLLYEQLLSLPFNRPIYIFALGTAAYQMTEAVLLHASHEDYIRIKGGLIITRYGNNKGPIENMKILEANHLVADENSLIAGEEAIQFLSKLQENDILLVLLSGGGSCLMEKTVVGVTLDDLNTRIQELYNSNASIEEIDSTRKKMSELKGGKLQYYIKPKEILIYAMSDIPGDIPRYIASNPFHLDAEEAAEAMGLDSFHTFDNLTSDRYIPQHKALTYKIIANNRNFLDVIKKTVVDVFDSLEADLVHVVDTELSGEASMHGREIANLAKLIQHQEGKEIAGFATPCLLIFGGIISANVKDRGNVGRVTELAMAAVEGISELMSCALLVYNTSGVEVFYDTAGVFIDNNSKQALLDKGIDIAASMQKHETFEALKAIDALLPPENSTLNVNEVVLLYIQ